MTAEPTVPQRHARSVLFLVNSLRVGGSERKAVRLANALALRGWSVAFAYLSAPETLLPELRAEVSTVNLKRHGKFSIRALRALAVLLRQRRVATLVAMNLYSSLYAVLAARLADSPGPRVAASINTTDFVSRKEQLQMLLYRHVLRRADIVVFGAERQRQMWCKRYGLNSSLQRSTVLYNGVDTRAFESTRITPAVSAVSTGRVTLGTVGVLRLEKGHTHLVRAVYELTRRDVDVGAIIVGEGPERNRIENEIGRLGLADRISLVGEVRDVRPYLASMDVFVLTSIGVETFSNAVLEAMAMSCPVVVSNEGGMGEMLQFGGGYTYAPGDVEQLCATLMPVVTDSQARRQLGEQARRAAEEHFSFDAMLRHFTQSVLVETT